MPSSNLLMRQAERLFATPLLAHPVKAAVVANALAPRLLGQNVIGFDEALEGEEALNVSAGSLTDRVRMYYDPHERLFDSVDGVAVVGIEGSLIAKGDWIGQSSGQTSYEGINAQIDDVRSDNGIKAVVYEVDSFGGEVDGCFECAERIYQLSLEKPSIAILTSHACSAGYMLASAANQIVVPQTGMVGSIGVISIHEEVSSYLDKQGIKISVLRAGARKGDFNPFEALGDDVATEYLAELEELRDLFCDTVAKHRGARLTKDQALATEAKTYRGPHAVAAGLVDVVADPAEAFSAFVETWGLAQQG